MSEKNKKLEEKQIRDGGQEREILKFGEVKNWILLK